MLPGQSPLSRGASSASHRFFGEEHAAFHEHGTFFAVWLLVMFVAVEILTNARAILEPILWAFFLMMGLVPLTDIIERAVLRATAKCSRTTASLGSERSCCNEQGTCATARTAAVFIVIVCTVGCAALFLMMVYRSAVHMQDSWPHYVQGAQIQVARLKEWVQTLPDEMFKKFTDKAVQGMEAALSSLVGGLLAATTNIAVEMLWVFLYMIFWLCQPVHVGKDVSDVFRRYIFLKGLASMGYAFCIWLLLHFLGVDLAIVFGLITFVLNFIPEVGPFIAMILPLPVILFDDRMERPLEFVLLALVGQLSLKVVFGNIVEIKLIESQEEMRMHPVVILFFVAFFQFIWGATGMLVSVPIVAALKATLHKIPPAYRNPILIFLEGDKTAPVRWHQWRDKLRRAANEVA